MQPENKTQNVPRTRKLKKLASVWEDNNGNLSITQNSQFLSFFEQPSSSFRECNLPTVCVFDPFYLYLASAHFYFSSISPIDQETQKQKTQQKPKLLLFVRVNKFVSNVLGSCPCETIMRQWINVKEKKRIAKFRDDNKVRVFF